MLNSYIFGLYFKYFLIILFALELFYVGVDYISVAPKLPDSANLKLLYVIHMMASALKITLPLSLVFGMIGAKIHLIRANELVVIYALGVSRRKVLKPFIFTSFAISLIYILANFTNFAYNQNKAQAINTMRIRPTVRAANPIIPEIRLVSISGYEVLTSSSLPSSLSLSYWRALSSINSSPVILPGKIA